MKLINNNIYMFNFGTVPLSFCYLNIALKLKRTYKGNIQFLVVITQKFCFKLFTKYLEMKLNKENIIYIN